MDFVNTTKDPAMDWLGPSVAETVTTKLNAIRSLQLVERAQLYQVLAEQKLSLSDLVDPTQALRTASRALPVKNRRRPRPQRSICRSIPPIQA